MCLVASVSRTVLFRSLSSLSLRSLSSLRSLFMHPYGEICLCSVRLEDSSRRVSKLEEEGKLPGERSPTDSPH